MSTEPRPRTSISWIRATCRSCGGEMIDVWELGAQRINTFPTSQVEADRVPKVPLTLARCHPCGLLQLRHTTNPDLLFGVKEERPYWYKSGIQPAMVAILKEVVEEAKALVPLKYGDTVIDIGANDGTLLGFYPDGIRRMGFEPARNLHQKLQEHSEVMVSTYFPAPLEVTQTYLKPASAKVISSCAVFYDLEDPLAFCEEVKRLLHPNGIWVNQLAYLPSMLDRSAFDSICHEHLTYWSFRALAPLLERAGLQVIKAQLLPEVNEGSIRFFITHRESKVAVQFADLKMLHELGVRETDEGYSDSNEPYLKLKRAAEDTKRIFKKTLFGAVLKDLKVDILGASTKGNTTCQYVGLDTTLIRQAVERSPDKWGRCTVTGIPIVSEEAGRAHPADIYLCLIWAFKDVLIQRELDLLKGGAKFFFPMPKPVAVEYAEGQIVEREIL